MLTGVLRVWAHSLKKTFAMGCEPAVSSLPIWVGAKECRVGNRSRNLQSLPQPHPLRRLCSRAQHRRRSLPCRSGLPWDQRQTKGLLNAFIETLQMVLSRPVAAFTAMKREGGLGEPLLYAIIGGTFGAVFAITYNFVLRSFTPFADRHDALPHLFAGLGWIFLLVLTPLFVVIGMFVLSAILHVCLMIVGGAKQSFETTFRVVCFAEGSASPLLVIPFCGGLITGIWKIVLYCIGLARAHETDTGRAVIAVLLPLIVCCGGIIFLIAMMFGAFGAWNASQH